MIIRIKNIGLVVVLSILLFNGITTVANENATLQDTLFDGTQLLKQANEFLDINPDSALVLYNKVLPIFEQQSDRINIIESHIGISDVYKNKGLYSYAYDHLWDALLIAEDIKDTISLINIYEDLGSLYSIYEKYDIALSQFYIAKKLAKQYAETNHLRQSRLINIYYSVAVTSRKNKQYSAALEFLDSCLIIKQKYNLSPGNTAFVDAERGCVYLNINQLDKAKEYLIKANDNFVEKQHSYRLITSLHLGDLYAKQLSWQRANEYYYYSLKVLEKSNAHGDLKVEILKKLSQTYNKLGETDVAYSYLNKALIITDSLFNAKTAINNQLFQIKNKYKETIKDKDDFIKEQNLIIERNKILHSRLKLLIGFILFIVIVFVLFIRMRYKLRKSAMEKKQLKLQAKYNKEKAEEIMEVKSRELTASTLKLIKKDQTIDELLQEMKKESIASYDSLRMKISQGNKDMWEQFNKRFTQVNTHFYEHLREKHPDLTPTEQKHCALIKLNFDSKEMASLLNISLNSVHISRHRIRKKIGLKRDDNLSNYIADL